MQLYSNAFEVLTNSLYASNRIENQLIRILVSYACLLPCLSFATSVHNRTCTHTHKRARCNGYWCWFRMHVAQLTSISVAIVSKYIDNGTNECRHEELYNLNCIRNNQCSELQQQYNSINKNNKKPSTNRRTFDFACTS